MNDREWEDYLRRQPGTFWGEFARQHDESIRSSTSVPICPAVSDPVRNDGPATDGASHRGGNIVDGLFGLAEWVIERLPPLKILNAAARRGTQVQWQSRATLAGIGAILFGTWIVAPANAAAVWPGGYAALHGFAGSYALCIAMVAGGCIGWVAPDMVAVGLALVVTLLGLAIGLGLIAAVLMLLYLGAAAMAQWPPFHVAPAGSHAAHTAAP